MITSACGLDYNFTITQLACGSTVIKDDCMALAGTYYIHH